MIVVVLLILLFVGGCVWQFIETRHALRTDSVLTRYTPQQAMQTIEDAFGGVRSVLWTNVRGPGRINKRRRGYKGGVTMSIDIEPLPDGGCRIDMWASAGYEYMGLLLNFAGVVNRRKRAIGRLLSQPNTARVVAANGDTSVQVNTATQVGPSQAGPSQVGDPYR